MNPQGQQRQHILVPLPHPAQQQPALRHDKVGPTPGVHGNEPRSNLALVGGVFEAGSLRSRMHGILPQKFITDCLGERDLMFRAELESASRPNVGVGKAAIMLVGPGVVGIDL